MSNLKGEFEVPALSVTGFSSVELLHSDSHGNCMEKLLLSSPPSVSSVIIGTSESV